VDKKKKKGKAIPVTGRGGPYGCEKSRLSHFLDSWFTNGGEDLQPYALKVRLEDFLLWNIWSDLNR
jgi:hypothetical protein